MPYAFSLHLFDYNLVLHRGASHISIIYQNLSLEDNSHDVRTIVNKILAQLRSLPANIVFEVVGNTILSGMPAYTIVFTSSDPLGVKNVWLD
ncbi:MAG TPA: hypothetical protein VE076_10540 [Nitrososphaeraceae archaeon]|jgi:hypothetical protein|nr:hypothetical protein [Nitrososphaeraceae archaeon]